MFSLAWRRIYEASEFRTGPPFRMALLPLNADPKLIPKSNPNPINLRNGESS